MDVDHFKALIDRHVEAEMVKDLDAAMETVCDDPHYEIHPLGYIIKGKDAVREYYRRALVMFDYMKAGDAPSGSFTAADDFRYVGSNGVVVYDDAVYQLRDGPVEKVKALSVFILDKASGLIKGELVYTNAATAKLFDEALGPDFSSVPGVTVE